MSGATLLGVLHDEAHALSAQLARISHLAARLGIEGRAIEHHLAPLTGAERVDLGTLLQQRQHAPRAGEPLVAEKLAARIERSAAAHIAPAELTRLLGAPPLLSHRRLEALEVDAQAALACDVGREIH